MVFYGKTTLHIGITPEMDAVITRDDQRKGRVETFEMAENEELYGCEIHHGLTQTYGITWLKRPWIEDWITNAGLNQIILK